MKKIVLFVMVALLVPAALAAEPNTGHLRLNAEYVVPMSDTTEEGVKAEADKALGFEASYEHMFNKMFGLELAIAYADHDIKANGSKIASVSSMPVLLNGNFHFLEGLDLYVGPTIGYAFLGDLKAENGFEFDEGQTSVGTKSQFVYGVNAGLDIPIGATTAITLGVRYLALEAEPDQPDSGKLKVDPLFVRAGIAFKF